MNVYFSYLLSYFICSGESTNIELTFSAVQKIRAVELMITNANEVFGPNVRSQTLKKCLKWDPKIFSFFYNNIFYIYSIYTKLVYIFKSSHIYSKNIFIYIIFRVLLIKYVWIVQLFVYSFSLHTFLYMKYKKMFVFLYNFFLFNNLQCI